jgi:hypothetical protein
MLGDLQVNFICPMLAVVIESVNGFGHFAKLLVYKTERTTAWLNLSRNCETMALSSSVQAASLTLACLGDIVGEIKPMLADHTLKSDLNIAMPVFV